MDPLSVLGVVLVEVRREIEIQTLVLQRGDLDDYPAYREKVGVIQGLRACERFVVDTNKKLEAYLD